jgi:hypothetical protein
MNLTKHTSSSIFRKFWVSWHIVAIAIVMVFAISRSHAIDFYLPLGHVFDVHIPTFEEYPSPCDPPDTTIEDEDGNEVPAWIV